MQIFKIHILNVVLTTGHLWLDHNCRKIRRVLCVTYSYLKSQPLFGLGSHWLEKAMLMNISRLRGKESRKWKTEEKTRRNKRDDHETN